MENYLTNLKKSDMFELIINQIGGVSLVGKDGRYVYVNQPFSEITGYSLEELKGRYVRDFFPDNLMDKVLVTGKSLVSVPYRIQNKNMETVQLISSYYPIWIDGILEGCIFLIVLRNMEQVMELSTNINELMEELSYYRESSTKVCAGPSIRKQHYRKERPGQIYEEGDSTGGPDSIHCVDRGGDRERQRTGCKFYPLPQQAFSQCFRQGELRRDPKRAVGVRVFRL